MQPYSLAEFQAPMLPLPAWSSFARRISLESSGLDIFLYDSGEMDKPPALMVHGLGDEADTWQFLFSPLAKTHRLIVPDLPGFGRSSKPKRKYSLDFFERVLLELATYLEISQSLWIGHSLGAMLCHKIALDHPERVNRLVLVSGAWYLPVQNVKMGSLIFMLPGIGEWWYTNLRRDPAAAYETLRNYYAGFNHLPQDFHDWLWLRVNQRVWDNAQRSAYFSTLRNTAWQQAKNTGASFERLGQHSPPPLIIWGAEDQILSTQNALILSQSLPGARAVIIPGAGHNVQQEKPAQVLEAIFQNILVNQA